MLNTNKPTEKVDEKTQEQKIADLTAIVEKQQSALSKILSDNDIISPFDKKEKGKKKRYIDVLPVKNSKGDFEDCAVIKHIKAIPERDLGGHEKYTMLTMEILKPDNSTKKIEITVENYLRQRSKELVTIEKQETEDVKKTYGVVEKKKKLGKYTTSEGSGIRVSQDVLETLTTSTIKRDNGQTFIVKE